MGTTMTDLFNELDRVRGEPAPVTPERQADTQRLLERLCAEYLETDADGRAAVRAFVAAKATGGDLWLMNECAHRLAERVTGPDAAPALRLALAAVSAENCVLDSRDTQLVLAKLYERAERAGLDPQPEFEAAAALSADSPTPGGCGSVAGIIRQAAVNGAMTGRRATGA
jgi:hypothetical protein